MNTGRAGSAATAAVPATAGSSAIRQANRERILAAAEAAFARAGFNGATVAAIAAAAGLPKANLHYYFGSKHALYREVLGDLMRGELRTVVARKVQVINAWIAEGRMAEVDAEHLFFTIWAATQTYADFDVQVRAVLGRSKLTRRDHERATAHVVALVLRGCGLA